MNLARVGLIVNPSAGCGNGLEIARAAMCALAPREVLVGAGEMGASALAGLGCALEVFDWSAHRGKARTTWLTRQIAQVQPDALVVIGGDGTLADVALVLYRVHQNTLPLLGIGVGSANVGPLITCRPDELQHLHHARFSTRVVDGVIAGANGEELGLGFNDVVLDFTVLATVNGQVVNVDAAQKMHGVNLPRAPEPVWGDQTCVVKHSPRGETLVAQREEVVTLIVGLPDERFYGKAIAGGVILSSFVGDVAGCLVCNHWLVTTRFDAEALHRAEPIVSRYVGLSEDDWLEVTGLRAGVALCADGNPLKILNPSDFVHVRARRGLACTLQIEE